MNGAFCIGRSEKNNKVEEKDQLLSCQNCGRMMRNPSDFDDESFLALAKSANVSKIDS